MRVSKISRENTKNSIITRVIKFTWEIGFFNDLYCKVGGENTFFVCFLRGIYIYPVLKFEWSGGGWCEAGKEDQIRG